MARRKRRIIPGHPYHVTHRGNHRSPILATVTQRAMYMSIMLRWQRRTGVRVAAFAIMPNHVHFIVVAPTPDALSKWIANGHREYSKWLNTTNSSAGHNWEERYYSVLMDPEHCLNALRYVEQNPVAAGLAEAPWKWHWSSAAFHCGAGERPSILDIDLRPGNVTDRAWRRALLEPSSQEFRARLHECAGRGIALSSEEWAINMEKLHGLSLRPGRRGRPRSSPGGEGPPAGRTSKMVPP